MAGLRARADARPKDTKDRAGRRTPRPIRPFPRLPQWRVRLNAALAVPVVDDDGVMMGIVTVDDALDTVIPTAWKKRLPRVFSRLG